VHIRLFFFSLVTKFNDIMGAGMFCYSEHKGQIGGFALLIIEKHRRTGRFGQD